MKKIGAPAYPSAGEGCSPVLQPKGLRPTCPQEAPGLGSPWKGLVCPYPHPSCTLLVLADLYSQDPECLSPQGSLHRACLGLLLALNVQREPAWSRNLPSLRPR